MHESPPLLALTLPLQGRQLIEASAGTGKTWTLAALYVRVVLGHGRGGLDQGLLPPQILVMTFTEAATAELRDRIRDRLQRAALAFAGAPSSLADDPFLAGLMGDIPTQEQIACAQRLEQAASWMDEAAIHTIHGWSMRALREHAFESRSLFDLQHLQDSAQIWLDLARDHVRQFIYPLPLSAMQALQAEDLSADPHSWLDALADRRQALQRTPQAPIDASSLPTPMQALASMAEWQAQDNAALDEVKRHFDAALVAEINHQKFQRGGLGHLRSNHIEALLARVMDWVEGRQLAPEPQDLKKLSYTAMVERQWPAELRHPALLAIDRWVEMQALQPASVRDALLDHALHHMTQAYRRMKEQAGLFDFQDLLERLYWAVQEDGQTLARVLREQYPIALVDEFQDTDPWQYGTLDRIYAPGTPSTWVMIGDPKQAIYSFRGADIETYLKARQRCLELDAHSQHALLQNRRSSPALLAVLNRLFGVHDTLFGPDIRFEPALSTPTLSAEPAGASDPACPVQVRVSEGWGGANAPAHRQFLLSHMIEHMVQLLDRQAARPQDLAVLVRSHSQADEVLKALSRSRIPAVYLSDRSQVYHSDEARDLWVVLQALAEPRRSERLRAALATPLWGLSDQALSEQVSSDDAWDTLLEQALGWHQHWLSHGIYPMLRLWLLDTGAARRLLSSLDGERRLTNLLHLGELLQDATHPMTAQGIATLPHATVRHLGQEIRRPAQEHSPAQTRLESDEARVKIVSFHKSKGLQYPHVFIPFLSSGSAAPELQKDDDDAPLDRSRDVLEDTRLLYVALTRAEHSLWLGVYPHQNEFQKGQSSALCRWLGRTDKEQAWGDIWHTLSTRIPGLNVERPGLITPPVWTPSAPAELLGGPKAAPAWRPEPWWSASFSSLTRQLQDPWGAAARTPDDDHAREVDTEELQAPDESSDAPGSNAQWQSFGAGARYGTVLHDALQWQADRDWPLAQGRLSSEWQARLERQPLLTEAEREMVSPWLTQVMCTPLPLPGADALVLADLRQPDHWAEMPFHFAVSPLQVQLMDELICEDLFAGQSRPALMPHRLGGMVNGFIDLVFQHQGRYWVMDYKSNRLNRYDPLALQSALLEKRYDVQSVLYLLALHRLLKVRVRGYDPAQHLGGAVYLFMRGIDTPSAGVVLQQPTPDLITHLDHVLGGAAEGAS